MRVLRRILLLTVIAVGAGAAHAGIARAALPDATSTVTNTAAAATETASSTATQAVPTTATQAASQTTHTVTHTAAAATETASTTAAGVTQAVSTTATQATQAAATTAATVTQAGVEATDTVTSTANQATALVTAAPSAITTAGTASTPPETRAPSSAATSSTAAPAVDTSPVITPPSAPSSAPERPAPAVVDRKRVHGTATTSVAASADSFVRTQMVSGRGNGPARRASEEPSPPHAPSLPGVGALISLMASAAGGILLFGLLGFIFLLAIPNAVRWLRPALALGLSPAYVASSDRPG